MRQVLAALVAAFLLWAPANDVRAEAAPPAPPAAVDFSPVLDWSLETIGAALVPFLAWLVMRGAKLLGLQLDVRQRDAIYTAMTNAVDAVAEQLKREGRDLAQIEVRDELVRRAAKRVVKFTPAAAKHFKLTPDDVEERVAAFLATKLPDPSAAVLPSYHAAERLADELAAVRAQLDRLEHKPPAPPATTKGGQT